MCVMDVNFWLSREDIENSRITNFRRFDNANVGIVLSDILHLLQQK